MLTDANEGFDSPRATAARIWGMSALFLLITVLVPSAVFISASSRSLDMTARDFLLPVLRLDQGATTDLAAVSTRHDPAMKLDARSTLDLFHAREYRIETVRSGETAVPRLVLTDLPTGMMSLENPDDRKALFVNTLLPLILIANEQIEQDRDRLRRLHAIKQRGQSLAPQDRRWLAALAQQYGLTADGDINTKALLQRVDVVPASMALAQAAEESGWGTSRFAQKGNALYGQLTFNDRDEGIVPRNRRQGETYRFRSFDDPKGSVESYIHNLNTHRAYAQFRQMRASLRAQDKPVEGLTLISALAAYSERGDDYVRTIRSLIRANALSDFDKAVLSGDQHEEVMGPRTRAELARDQGVIPANLRR